MPYCDEVILIQFLWTLLNFVRTIRWLWFTQFDNY